MIIYLFIRIMFDFLFMLVLIQLKNNTKKSYAFMITYNIILWLICVAIYNFRGEEYLNSVFTYVVVVPAFICFLVVSKHKGFKLLFTFISVCNFGMLRTYIGVLSLYYVNNLIVRTTSEVFCAIIILILLLKIYRKPYFTLLDTLDKGWILLCSVPVLQLKLNNSLLHLKIPEEYANIITPIVFLSFTLMFVFYAVVFLNFENISHYFKLKESQEVMQLQIEMQKKEYEVTIDKINNTQIYRHDMKHHINVMNTFLNDNNIEETKNYLEKLNDNLNNTIIETYCENYVLNVILSTYINKAKSENIKVESKVDISKNIKTDNIELGLIFTNSIENAINACKKITNFRDRWITINCREQHGQLSIQISNPFDGNIQFDGEFPVSNDRGHGIGTRSIAAICAKYDGIFSFNTEESIFKTTVILNI